MERSTDAGRFGCVHMNLIGALDIDAMAIVNDLLPPDSATLVESKTAYESITEFLIGNARWAFSPGKRDYCLVHREMCPVNPGHAVRQTVEAMKSGCVGPDLSHESLHSYRYKGSDKMFPECATKEISDDDECHMPLCMSTNGLVCVDWSRLGRRKAKAGPSSLGHSI